MPPECPRRRCRTRQSVRLRPERTGGNPRCSTHALPRQPFSWASRLQPPRPIPRSRSSCPPASRTNPWRTQRRPSESRSCWRRSIPSRSRKRRRCSSRSCRGSQLDGTRRLVRPGRVAVTWAWLAERHGLDAKTGRSIAKDKFAGPAELFDALDRDGDGKLAAGDLDWSDRNPYVMQADMVNAALPPHGRERRRQADPRGTRRVLQAAGDGKDHFTADDFRRAMIPRGPAGFSPGDAPVDPGAGARAVRQRDRLASAKARRSATPPPTSP